MIGLSLSSELPPFDLWEGAPNVSQASVGYAKKFIAKLGDTASKFDWKLLHLSDDNPLGIISGYYECTANNTAIILNFHANGECQFHATSADQTFNNTCYLDDGPDDWLAVQTTLDTVKLLVG